MSDTEGRRARHGKPVERPSLPEPARTDSTSAARPEGSLGAVPTSGPDVGGTDPRAAAPAPRPAWAPLGSAVPGADGDPAPAADPDPLVAPSAHEYSSAEVPDAAGSSATQGTPPALPPTDASQPVVADGEPPRRGRRGLVIAIVVAVVVLIAAGVTAYVLLSGDDDDTVAAPPAVVLPSPTATVAPVARTATTPFATALPTTVLQYALASSADEPTFLAGGALEAYAESYTDGGAGQATVLTGQWETPDAAAAFATTLLAALPAADATGSTASTDGAATLPATGDVLAGGQTVGTYTIVDAGDGTGIAVWTNGTAVFRATVPLADVQNFYTAYPL